MMTGRGRTIQILLGSHTIVFLAGFVAGKYIDYDELQQYRSNYESTSTRFKRKAGQLGIAVLAIGTVAAVVKIATRIQKSST